MQVNDLAQRLGISTETVRYYSRIGLLHPSKNPINGYRQYSETDQRRLRFCIRARQLGFSLADIREFLDTSESGEAPCPKVRAIMAENLADMERSLREAQLLFERMRSAYSSWEQLDDCGSNAGHICRLIESWDREVDC